jgi:hypothetical protein
MLFRVGQQEIPGALIVAYTGTGVIPALSARRLPKGRPNIYLSRTNSPGCNTV